MPPEIDVIENDILEQYPKVLEILLRDHTSKNNIIWATDNYQQLGTNYQSSDQILIESITGSNGSIIMPRVKKNQNQQQLRSREMAEVFTPSWVCNAQNNLVDSAWFARSPVFNIEVLDADQKPSWNVVSDKITFPPNKSWRKYITDTRLEMACGEGPYLTSRYDTTTGDFIPIEKRIGLIDRKLRIVSENVSTSSDWLKSAQAAYQTTYGYEWQGDSLLLAREAMLITFIENYCYKFAKQPLLRSIQYMAYIISWNLWQMDGIKGVIPNTCKSTEITQSNLFDEPESITKICEGCHCGNLRKHNGIYCMIKSWSSKDKSTGKIGKSVRFIDLIKS
jgi:hypothetical protein